VRKIVQVFADNGVEFDSDYGVRAKQENYRVLEGEDCFLRLLDEVYYSTHQRGLEVLFICVDDAVSTPEVVAANKRILDGGAPCRYLASVNAKRFDYDLKNYRLIPEKHYKNSLMVIYGDKVATLRGTNDAVLIIKDKEQAEMLRGLFEIIWAQSPAPQKRAKA
jgi:hypothetical protein